MRPFFWPCVASGYFTNEEDGARLPATVACLIKPFDMQLLRWVLEAVDAHTGRSHGLAAMLISEGRRS